MVASFHLVVLDAVEELFHRSKLRFPLLDLTATGREVEAVPTRLDLDRIVELFVVSLVFVSDVIQIHLFSLVMHSMGQCIRKRDLLYQLVHALILTLHLVTERALPVGAVAEVQGVGINHPRFARTNELELSLDLDPHEMVILEQLRDIFLRALNRFLPSHGCIVTLVVPVDDDFEHCFSLVEYSSE